jgi:hypothetical protein
MQAHQPQGEHARPVSTDSGLLSVFLPTLIGLGAGMPGLISMALPDLLRSAVLWLILQLVRILAMFFAAHTNLLLIQFLSKS